ncbi:hypothetical protein [Lacrimispora amygdalina]|uniref:hypothetical protein n=1 Tax=Lacrimispora amygdalina TaxID=253257 RepID=UPI000BE25546|nr:hypothetical protein [Lacrimispora amygdalina]
MKDILLLAILFMTGVVIFDVISLIRDLILRNKIIKNPQLMAKSKKVYTRMYCAFMGYELEKLLYDDNWRVRNEVAKKGYCLDVLINDKNNTVKKTAQLNWVDVKAKEKERNM